MKELERIRKDIELFKKNIKETETIKFYGKEERIIKRAISYYKDTEYYIEKKDFFTAFGCISYAHGLIDALRIIHELI
jgi:uncharacterized protein